MHHTPHPPHDAPAGDERHAMLEAAERIIAASRKAYAEPRRTTGTHPARYADTSSAGATVRPWMS